MSVRAAVDELRTWTVASVEELRNVIRDVSAYEHPTMLFLENELGATLVVGLGMAETVLCFVEPDGTSFHSVGDVSRRGTLLFSCRSQFDEFMEEMAIPLRVGVDAAEHFFVSGQKSREVEWEADW